MKENKYKIGKILRSYRRKNHYTQEQLAETIGVTPGFLGQIERDETYPSIDNLTKIIHVLDIDANAIFHPESEEQDPTSILVNEFKIQFTKLSKNNQEIVTFLMKKMVEQQKKEA